MGQILMIGLALCLAASGADAQRRENWATALGRVLEGYAADKANNEREAAAAQARMRAAEQALAASRIEQTRYRLYEQRAGYVGNHLKDSLGISPVPEVFDQWRTRTVNAVLDIYDVNPVASTSDIRDQLLPIAMEARAATDRFMAALSQAAREYAATGGVPSARIKAFQDRVVKTFIADRAAEQKPLTAIELGEMVREIMSRVAPEFRANR